jgi:hypothetical protein
MLTFDVERSKTRHVRQHQLTTANKYIEIGSQCTVLFRSTSRRSILLVVRVLVGRRMRRSDPTPVERVRVVVVVVIVVVCRSDRRRRTFVEPRPFRELNRIEFVWETSFTVDVRQSQSK